MSQRLIRINKLGIQCLQFHSSRANLHTDKTKPPHSSDIITPNLEKFNPNAPEDFKIQETVSSLRLKAEKKAAAAAAAKELLRKEMERNDSDDVCQTSEVSFRSILKMFGKKRDATESENK